MLLVAAVLSVAIGACGGYLGYFVEAEGQFHGGVLDEDAAHAQWALVLEAAVGFAKAGGVAVLLIGIVPLAIWRLIASRRDGEV